MPRRLLVVLAILLGASPAMAQLRWQEGVHYATLDGGQTTGAAAGRIEVTEVFSYVCGACAQAHAPVEQLKSALPADAALTFVHAGFNTHWPLFQRGFVTAQLLGIAEANHARFFQAIWETAEFPFFDRATGKLREPVPTIADIARFYAKSGAVSEADFLKKAASPEVEAAIRRSEDLVKAWRVPSTPTFVVNGRYRIDNSKLSSWNELSQLVNHLVGLERARLKK